MASRKGWLTLAGALGIALLHSCSPTSPASTPAAQSPATSTNPGSPTTQTPAQPNPAKPGAQTPANPGVPAVPASQISFASGVVPVLKEHCAGCHTTGRSGARAVEMFNTAGDAQYEAVKAKIGEMIGAIKAGRMPKGAPGSVPDEQVQTLESWQGAGSPNN